MTDPLAAGLAGLGEDPWAAARALLGGPLHPGGEAATVALLDRAGVGEGTLLLDLGSGAGDATALAADLGARAVGLDRSPAGPNALRGEIAAVPVADGSVDVVLSECTLCLAESLAAPLAEARRILAPGGRLAVSDMVVAGDVPDLPPRIASLLCLTGRPDRAGFLEAIEAAGFAVEDVRDHREDLLALRDRIASRVEYDSLLGTMEGTAGLESGVRELERAVEDGRIGYVSVVATGPAETVPDST